MTIFIKEFTPILNNMTDKQQKIYDGLRLIGEDIAAFYKGGLEVLCGSNPVKAHLLAHCGRELDSIMRDTFSYDDAKKTIQQNLKSEEFDTLKKTLNNDNISGNTASILAALNVPLSSQLAIKWITVSTQFAGLAHRDSKLRLPRTFEESERLWNSFESVLFDLVGHFNSIYSRVLRIIDRPSNQIIDRLPNLFQNKALKHEFYKTIQTKEWLEPLYDKNFFDPANIESEYYSDVDKNRLITPVWIEFTYLIRMGEKNAKSQDVSVTKHLLNFIDLYLDYKDIDGRPVNNLRADMQLIELIITIPSNQIKENFIDFICQKINKDSYVTYDIIELFIPKLVNDNAKELLFKLIIFLIKPIKKSSNNELYYNQYSSILIDTYLLPTFYDKLPLISKHLGVELFKQIQGLINELITTENEYLLDSSAIQNISLSKEDYYNTEPFKLLVHVAYNLLYYYETDLSSIIETLLNSKEEINQRTAIQLLAEKYQDYKDILWNHSFVLKNKGYLDRELCVLINRNVKQFTHEEICQLIQILETYDAEYIHNNNNSPEENEKYRCSQILNFLYLLKPCKSVNVDEKIQEYIILSGDTISNFSNSSFSNDITWTIGKYIPESAKSFNQKSPEQILDYLNNFSEVDELGRSLKDNALYALQNNIIDEPNKYFQKLDIFLGVEEDVFCKVIEAIEQLAQSNTLNFVYWCEVLTFINNWLSSDKLKTKRGTMPVLLLIETGTNKYSFEEFISLEKAVLIKLTQLIKPEITVYKPVSYYPVSNYSVLIKTLIEFSLRASRINLKEELNSWDSVIKNWLESEIRNNPSIDLFLILGKYFSSFDILEKGWFLKNIELVLPQDDTHWYASFSSHIFEHQQVPSAPSAHIYKILGTHGDYKRIFEYNNTQFIKLETVQRNVMYNVCWYYINISTSNYYGLGLVELSKSILDEIIQLKNPKYLEVILETLADYGSDNEIQSNDVDFRYILKQIIAELKQNISNPEYQNVAGKFNETIKLVCSLDDNEIIDWFSYTIPYLNHRGSSLNVFRGLKLHSQHNLKQVGNILVEFSKGYQPRYILYGLEELKYIVNLLYVEDLIEIADKICDNFGNNHFHECRDIYHKYHSIL